LYVIYRSLPGESDLIILYYCLMATWTGLGDNTKLFWAVLSQRIPRSSRRRADPTRRFEEAVACGRTRELDPSWGRVVVVGEGLGAEGIGGAWAEGGRQCMGSSDFTRFSPTRVFAESCCIDRCVDAKSR
jgi:hypothetical protein